MEFEVKVVGGIESCYVSLPLLLIQQFSPSTFLPHLLALELRSNNHDLPWFVAWSGSASSSSSIEVAQQFADCINLEEGTRVQVRAVTNLPIAEQVTIEPHSEDDWEVMELNAEHAETAILSQVRIVQDGMRFPLWLHGHTVVTFLVVSTDPKKGVVQLAPGTEVAVAPKRRKKVESREEACIQSSDNVHPIPWALRVQDQDMRFIRTAEVNGVELGVVLTSVAYIHPETAKNYSLESLHLVVMEPRFSTKDSIKNQKNETLRKKSGIDKRESRHAVVRILISESVTEGHLMISRSLRLYMRAHLHSWIYVKRCGNKLEPYVSSVSMSPCHFKILAKNKTTQNNDVEAIDKHNNHKSKNIISRNNSDAYMNMVNVDLTLHEDIVTALSHEFSSKENEQTISHSEPKKGLQSLLQAWFFVQLAATFSNVEADINSVVLGHETLLHFQVRDQRFGTHRRRREFSNVSLKSKKQTGELAVDIFYVLSFPEEHSHDGNIIAYEFVSDVVNERKHDLVGLEVLFGNLSLADPVSFYTSREKISDGGFTSSISSLSWMATSASDVTHRLNLLLSSTSGKLLSTYNLPLPGHVLIYGPSGSGKTLLARAVAKSLEEDENLLAHIIFISCSGLALEKATVIRQSLSDYISEALDHAPSLVILDDLDNIMSSSTGIDGSQPSMSIVALVEFMTDIMDEYEEKRNSSCGIGPIAFLACVQSLESIPQSLSSSGRFDYHVQLPAPAANERGAILKHEIQRRLLECSDDILLDVAATCDGYDAYDLETLVDRTVHAAVGRFMSPHSTYGEEKKPTLLREDFSLAMEKFLPVAMRDITKSTPEGGHSGWDDVGGLTDIRNAITEMIELPSKFPNIFAHAPMRLRSNVLLYGPPGCGKTHIVGAAAAACSLRFISIKGPELLNKYIGASEQAVRDIFSKAAAAAPCLLFFDEFDSIAPKRGHDNTGVTDRVVNQFLTELDGVEVLAGVFVFAATSRPDLLDAALLRPGRLDRLLFCDFPSSRERLEILSVLARKLPLASDVDLDTIAYSTEGFSGADLQALLSDAQLAAVHELLESTDNNNVGKMPIITDALLKSIASNAKSSISDSEKQRLYGIYSQFLNSKRSVSAQSRDSKGKRATLA